MAEGFKGGGEGSGEAEIVVAGTKHDPGNALRARVILASAQGEGVRPLRRRLGFERSAQNVISIYETRH